MYRIRSLKLRTPLVATTIFATSLLFVTYGALREGSTRNSDPAAAEITMGGSAQSVTAELEVELITLRPAGFEPSEISRPQGPFVLLIDDRSGKEHSSLVLQRVGDERLRAISLNRKKSEWHDVIDLPRGNYVLQNASNPELRCQITILP